MVTFKPLIKLLQKNLYTFLGTWSGFFTAIISFFILIHLLLFPSTSISPCQTLLRGSHIHCSQIDFSDNIGGINLESYLAYGPIDAVYSWVNGSDHVWAEKKSSWFAKLSPKSNSTNTSKSGDDTVSHNRFRDSEELRYSLRSLEKYAPWIRKIFLVTDNQVPYWLNLENSRIQIVPHTEIFPNKSHLPVFSSPAIESHIHRIKGLSKKFIYFNDDVFLGAPTYPEDFYFIGGAQRLYQAWDVPKCAPGCSDSWIGDGYCDKACNVSSCNYDFPDCVNGTTGNQRGRGNTLPSKEAFFCATGCPDSWLGDKVCDQKCKTIECGWDAGDCGVDLIVEDFAGVTPLEVDYSNITIQKQRHQSFEVLQNLQQYTNPSISNILHPQYDHSSSPANQSDILFPVVLTVPYGSYAAYVNLSYFPCSALQIPSPLRVPNQKVFPFSAAFSPTCSENDIVSPFGPLGGPVGHYRSKVSEIPTWTNFTYTSMNYTIVPVKKFNSSGDLNEEDLKEIENAVSFSILIIKHNLLMILLRGHDKEFSDSGTPKKVFNYRDPLDVRFNISGYNIVTGINVTSLFTIRLVSVHPDVEEDHSIPEGMNLIDGISSSCIDPKQSSDRDILHLTSLYHHRSPFQSEDNSRQGIVVSLSIAGLSSQLYYTPLSKIHSLITITLLSGELYRHQYDLCESLGLVTPFQRTIKRNFLGSVPICENSILLGDLFYPRGNSVETAEPIDLLLPVPISWSTFPVNASGVGFPLHATLELFVSNSTSLISKSYLNTTDSPENRILCFTGSFRWGTRKIPENLEIFLNVTNGTALTNTTTNSTNATVPITEAQTEQVIEKVDTYASSLRHVNSLYHKAFGAENRKVPAHMPHMIDIDIMNEMQEKWKEEWEKTSNHRFRSPEDMQYAFAYYYYVIHRHKARPPNVTVYIQKEVDTDGDGYLNDNEFLTLAALTYHKSPTDSELEELRNCTSANYTDFETIDQEHLNTQLNVSIDTPLPGAISDSSLERNSQEQDSTSIEIEETHQTGLLKMKYHFHRYPSVQDAVNCNISYTGLLKNVHWPLTHKLETDHSVSFEMIGDNITNTLQQLNSVRYRKTKFICINDQMENPSPELKQILKDFYLSFFPYPSQFELPSYRRNPTLYYDEYLKLYPRIDSRRFSHSISTRYTDIYLSTMSYLRQFLLENIWSLYEWLSGRVHPSTALIHWSKGEKLNKPKKGIELFIPYSSLFWGSIGLCCLIGLRLLIRNDRKRHLKSKKNTIFTGMIDSEKRRYYQTSGRKSTEEEVESMEGGDDDDDGEQIHYDHEEDEQFANAEIVETLNDDDKEEEEEEEDPLNKLWRTAGYGVSGKKHSNKFIKGHDGVTVEDGEIQRKSSDVDDLTVSTLGIDGLEEDRGGDNSEDIGPIKKKKTVRWGGNSVAGESSSKGGTMTQMIRDLKKNFQDSRKKNM